jgi:hypothetical protein
MLTRKSKERYGVFALMIHTFDKAHKANFKLFSICAVSEVFIYSNNRIFFPDQHRRMQTETFADTGRCKSKTSFHRGWREERLFCPRPFRRSDL